MQYVMHVTLPDEILSDDSIEAAADLLQDVARMHWRRHGQTTLADDIQIRPLSEVIAC